MINPVSSKFLPSNEDIPPRDPRDAAVKSLNAKCRNLIEIAHDLQDAERKLFDVKCAEKVDLDALSSCAIRFGQLEEKFYNLMETIERDRRHYVQECGMSIYLSHTESGMPIRVNDKCRKSIWA